MAGMETLFERIQMVKGDKGEKGDKGDKGEKGDQGVQGQSISGPKGDNGRDGKNGRNGTDGRDGKDGKDGKNGTRGRDASSQEIMDAVLKQISGGNTLKIDHIDGLPKTLAELVHHLKMGGFRGGGGSAGSSAATIYTETPQGLVDGSNTVYTTAHNITTVLNLVINGQFIHPAEYTITGAGFTMGTALPVELAGTGFTIIYS